jgi:NAD(P)-dependent dehydrogenase (short-subunit alcohol dehydrogenase family)
MSTFTTKEGTRRARSGVYPLKEIEMDKLTGKVAVITGGTSGIGLATAQRFVAEGAYLFITGRRKEALDAAMAQIGKNVTGIRGDVANLADLDELYNSVRKQNRKIDILFAISKESEAFDCSLT